jgi:hypothetical protein
MSGILAQIKALVAKVEAYLDQFKGIQVAEALLAKLVADVKADEAAYDAGQPVSIQLTVGKVQVQVVIQKKV